MHRISIAIIIALAVAPASAGMLDKLKDPETGQIDITDWLLSGSGFLPIPIIITEPAVGFGLGFAPAFLHDFNHPGVSRDSLTLEDILEYPPSVTAGFAAYTTNGSWLAGAVHKGSYRQDRIRYLGVLAYMDLNLDYYVFSQPLRFELEGVFTIQDVRFRLGRTNWFLGANYSYLNSDVAFKLGIDPNTSLTLPGNFDSSDAGLSAIAYFDSRDTSFTPSTGREAEFKIGRHDEALGGDFNYWVLDLDYKSFHRVHPSWVVGWRAKGEAINGDPPFYSLPFVWMRGIPAMRYQGDTVAQVETEVRWTIKGPWNLVGFVGYGNTWSDNPSLDSDDLILSGGAGVRIEIARKLGFMTGIDIARGPEEWAVYLQFGQAWGH
jgi:hypothetical protein